MSQSFFHQGTILTKMKLYELGEFLEESRNPFFIKEQFWLCLFYF